MDADGHRWPRRVLLAATAQAASSATNLALYLGLLASTDTDRFGRLVAVLGVYHLALALSRSLVSEPMVANGRTGGAADRAFSWPWARRRLVAIGLTAAVLTVLVGRLVSADGVTTAAIAAAVPAMIGQDGVRNLAWSGGRPRSAVALDLVWLAVGAAGLAILAADGPIRPEPVVVTWLAGGLVSAAVAAALAPRLVTTDTGSTGQSAGGQVDGVEGVGVGGQVDGVEGVGVGGQVDGVEGESVEGDGTSGRAPIGWRPAEIRVGVGQLHRRRRSHGLLITARNLLPIVVAMAVEPAAAGLLKAALLPFTPMLTLFGGLRLVVLPAMQRAAEAGGDGRAGDAGTPLDRFVVRLVGWYAIVATTISAATVAAVVGLSETIGLGDTADVVGWGAVVAVITVLVRPLAEAIGFGRRTVDPVRLRLVELAVEWGGVFLAVAVAGPGAVVAGWATGMALGGLVWVAVGLGGDHRRVAVTTSVRPPATTSRPATTGRPSERTAR
ncbi:MAG: hypothetical protein AAGA93_27315 [Actinomycetota bacterium]